MQNILGKTNQKEAETVILLSNLKLKLKNFEAYSVIPIPQYIFFFNSFNFKKRNKKDKTTL